MMQSEVSFQLETLAHCTKESASGSWPTPSARDWKDINPRGVAYAASRDRHQPSFVTEMYLRGIIATPASIGERLMGFPQDWTDV